MNNKKNQAEFNIEQLENGAQKISLAKNPSIYIIIDSLLKVEAINHPKLMSLDLNLLKKHLISFHIDRLLEIDLSLLYQLKQKFLIKSDHSDISKEDFDLSKEFINLIELEKIALLNQELEELRSIGLYVKYPETNGRILTEQLEGHLICRCFGVTRQTLYSFIEDNVGLELKELTARLSLGAGCGTCIEDAKLLLDEKKQKIKLSPIEWVLMVDHDLKSRLSKGWGVFLDANDTEVSVQLSGCSKEDFQKVIEGSKPTKLKIIYC